MTSTIYPIKLLQKYYEPESKVYPILLEHSRLVSKKAMKIARALSSSESGIDLDFIAEAAMLHDIGIFMTDAPDLGCFGKDDYMLHGIRGREILEKEGLFRHARVCERHIGVGLTAETILHQGLPLPVRDMRPETLEEQIICYADLFFSKGKKNRGRERTISEVRKKLVKYGQRNVTTFNQWVKRFESQTG